MSLDTVENALELYRNMCKESGSVSMTIGGGEPTLHPDFFRILERCIIASGLYSDDEMFRPYIVSNGFNEKISKKLIKLAEKGLIGLRFSVDQFHVSLEHEDVLMAWNTRNQPYYSTELFNVIRTGRAKKTGSWNREDMCCCDALFVNPSGKLFFCGCRTKALGNVNTSYDIPDYYFDMQGYTEACSKKIKRYLLERKNGEA